RPNDNSAANRAPPPGARSPRARFRRPPLQPVASRPAHYLHPRLVASMVTPHAQPLVVLVGPTASGKTSLAIRLAQEFDGEIISCDSVAVYREMEIGTAKPTREERSLIQHHMIDIAWPNEPCTAGDYSRQAREALTGITERQHLPIVAGGTGLYLRALIDGLFPAPPQKPGQRERLHKIASTRGPAYLHRLLTRLDPAAAAA